MKNLLAADRILLVFYFLFGGIPYAMNDIYTAKYNMKQDEEK